MRRRWPAEFRWRVAIARWQFAPIVGTPSKGCSPSSCTQIINSETNYWLPDGANLGELVERLLRI
ncbi:hypothetical protein [Sphingomonas sp. J315]|uniref:hypothetical protein n=1 Tax=Sphingomonas sp. J315 TaxID=2898433 RepID=UPI0021AE0CFF|nr:hypothetical protein [Sphingomonas sp. J315]UUY00457.1 hypothetical protein LRS08_04955 [Sphingomonas sp. J315]